MRKNEKNLVMCILFNFFSVLTDIVTNSMSTKRGANGNAAGFCDDPVIDISPFEHTSRRYFSSIFELSFCNRVNGTV